jgi:hypothetical protein
MSDANEGSKPHSTCSSTAVATSSLLAQQDWLVSFSEVVTSPLVAQTKEREVWLDNWHQGFWVEGVSQLSRNNMVTKAQEVASWVLAATRAQAEARVGAVVTLEAADS